jgi:hypothetical protein
MRGTTQRPLVLSGWPIRVGARFENIKGTMSLTDSPFASQFDRCQTFDKMHIILIPICALFVSAFILTNTRVMMGRNTGYMLPSVITMLAPQGKRRG